MPHRDSRSSSSVTVSAVFHTITAGVFLAAGCAHASNLIFISGDSFDAATLLVVRAVLGSFMFLSVLGMLFGALYLYYTAAKEFNVHYYPQTGPPTALPVERDLTLRKRMLLLAVLQVVYGV